MGTEAENKQAERARAGKKEKTDARKKIYSESISFNVKVDLYEALMGEAERQGVTRTALISEILNEYARKHLGMKKTVSWFKE